MLDKSSRWLSVVGQSRCPKSAVLQTLYQLLERQIEEAYHSSAECDRYIYIHIYIYIESFLSESISHLIRDALAKRCRLGIYRKTKGMIGRA